MRRDSDLSSLDAVSAEKDYVPDLLCGAFIESLYCELESGAGPADLDLSLSFTHTSCHVVEVREETRGQLSSVDVRPSALKAY